MSVYSARLFARSLALPMSKAFMHVCGSFLHELWGITTMSLFQMLWANVLRTASRKASDVWVFS